MKANVGQRCWHEYACLRANWRLLWPASAESEGLQEVSAALLQNTKDQHFRRVSAHAQLSTDLHQLRRVLEEEKTQTTSPVRPSASVVARSHPLNKQAQLFGSVVFFKQVTAVTFHTAMTAFGDQPSVVVATAGGSLVKCNSDAWMAAAANGDGEDDGAARAGEDAVAQPV